MSRIGERLKILRGKISQDDFSQIFSIHRNTLARWESGEREPDVAFLVQLAAREGIAHKWLLTGNGPMHEEPLSAPDTADNEKPATCRRSEKINTLKYINKTKKESATVAGDVYQGEINVLNKELRDLMRENATILRENGDLRVDVERKKARIAELERELARVLKGEETPPVAEVG